MLEQTQDSEREDSERDYNEIKSLNPPRTDPDEEPQAPEFPASAREHGDMSREEILRHPTRGSWIERSETDTSEDVTHLQSKCTHFELELKRAKTHESELDAEVKSLYKEKESLITEQHGFQKEKESLITENNGFQKEKESLITENSNFKKDLMQFKEKFWVLARIRSKISGDQDNDFLDLTVPSDQNHSLVLRGSKDTDGKHPEDAVYKFDRVFHQHEKNKDVYDYLRPMISAAIEGVDLAIILDGPSGSGKSHTMFAPPYGLAFLIAKDIFPKSSASGESAAGQLQVQVYYFKVYQNELLDATSKQGEDNDPLEIRVINGKLEVFIPREGAGTAPKIDPKLVSTEEEFTSEMNRVFKNREVHETAQNTTSSRGHTICQLKFSHPSTNAPASNLFLIDLAGPEDYNSRSPYAKETNQINQDRGGIKSCLEQRIYLQQFPPDPKKSDEIRRNCRARTVS